MFRSDLMGLIRFTWDTGRWSYFRITTVWSIIYAILVLFVLILSFIFNVITGGLLPIILFIFLVGQAIILILSRFFYYRVLKPGATFIKETAEELDYAVMQVVNGKLIKPKDPPEED